MGSTAANASALIARFLVGFLAFAILFRVFDDAEIGLYTLALSFVLLVQLASGAVAIAVSKHVAEDLAKGSPEGIRAAIRAGYLFNLIPHGLAAVLLIVLTTAVPPETLNVPADQVQLFRSLAILAAGLLLLQGPLSVSAAVMAGMERFVRRSGYELLGLAPYAVGAYLVWRRAIGLPGFLLLSEGGRVLAGALMWAHVRALLGPGPALDKGLVAATYRRMRGLILHQGMNQASDYMLYTADRLILQAAVGPGAVGQYAAAERPNGLAQQLIFIPLTAIVPRVARLIQQGDAAAGAFTRLGGEVYLAMVMPPLTALLVFMDIALSVWLGEAWAAMAWPARLLLVGLLAGLPFRFYSHIMLGRGDIRRIAWVKTTYAVANVPASFFLALHLGVIGVVIPTVGFWVLAYPLTWLSVMQGRGESAAYLMGPALKVALAQMTTAAIFTPLRQFWEMQPIEGLVTAIVASLCGYLIAYACLTREGKAFVHTVLGRMRV